MMFYLGFFVGWVIGIFSATMLVYLVRRETEHRTTLTLLKDNK